MVVFENVQSAVHVVRANHVILILEQKAQAFAQIYTNMLAEYLPMSGAMPFAAYANNLAQRTAGTRFSMQRKTQWLMCCTAEQVSSNQASLVWLINNRAPLRTARRATSGIVSSKQIRLVKGTSAAATRNTGNVDHAYTIEAGALERL